MPMKPFGMTDQMRLAVSNFIEQYHLTEERGQITFTVFGEKFILQNFGSMAMPIKRTLVYTMLRNQLHEVFNKLDKSMEIQSKEMWDEGFQELAHPYNDFMSFCLEDSDQINRLLNTLSNHFITNKENNAEFESAIRVLVDLVGIADYAVAYGTYLITEFTRLIVNEDHETLLENENKFPVILKQFGSQEEVEAFMEKMHQEEVESNDITKLENMQPIGSA